MTPAGPVGLRLKTVANAAYRALRIYGRNHSPRVWARGASYAARHLAGRAGPHTVTFHVTFRCQCRCVHCCSNVEDLMAVPEMSGEQAKDVISQIARLGVPHMIFAGGEPLLREDLPELIAHAHQLGIVTRMSTNGLLLTRERVRELKRAGLDVCGVSLDSPDAEVHDRLRGVPGTFDRAVRGLRYLREEGVFTKLLGCASRENVSSGGVERLIELGRELRVSTIYLLLPIMAGRWADAQHEVLTGSEMDYVRGLHDFTRIHMELAAPDNICCLSSKGVLCVRAGGDVTACPYVPFGMGNVNAEPLAAIWARHAAALEVVTPGHCPLNVPAAREELRLHSEAVRAGGPGGAPDR